MWMSGILTAVGLVFIVGKFSTNVLERMLGNFAVVVDATITLGIMLLFGATGTISGVMTAVTTGLSVSVILLLAKKLGSYQDFEKQEDGTWGWTRRHGDWTFAFLAQWVHEKINGTGTFVSQIKEGWNRASNVVPIQAA